MPDILSNSLVLYKKHPGRVIQSGEKLEVELDGGERLRLRPKDVSLLHPGPLHSLSELSPQTGDVLTAWELLRDSGPAGHDLAELAELIYGEYTPASAWAAWEYLEDGLYFRGAPQAVTICSLDEVQKEQAARQARTAELAAWQSFLLRARRGALQLPQDRHYLAEVEDLALGRRTGSRLMRELSLAELPEAAHAFLLRSGCWDENVNPYPLRRGLPVTPPDSPLPALMDEPRTDLTSLAAFAIDDRGSRDPDDAISLENSQFDAQGRLVSGRIWVHVADAAALVLPGSPADLEARGRGATLYLPEGAVPMLPPQAVQTLGLGLQEISPALSFGLELGAAGEITQVEIVPSWVRVQRLTYEQAEEQVESGVQPFLDLYRIAQVYLARRLSAGALSLEFPEVMLHLEEGEVVIRPVLRLRSRTLVREAMLMAGEAAALFASQHNLPFPYAVQDAPDGASFASLADAPLEDDLAAQYALRRTLKRSQVSSHAGLHAGVGLSAYARATSPLRRYLDLVVHQQVRACLRSQPLLDAQELLERVGASEAITGAVNQAEALSRRHWTLVYLKHRPGWQGEGILVEKNNGRARLIIPELALETNLHLQADLPLNSRINLVLRVVNLPELDAYFAMG